LVTAYIVDHVSIVINEHILDFNVSDKVSPYNHNIEIEDLL